MTDVPAYPPKTMADVQRAIARLLADMHRETLAMQSEIGRDLASMHETRESLLSLQALDRHAQVLLDLSKLAHKMAPNLKYEDFDIGALKDVVSLRSTVEIIFDEQSSVEKSSRDFGEVLLF